jgi:hypothetical protein
MLASTGPLEKNYPHLWDQNEGSMSPSNVRNYHLNILAASEDMTVNTGCQENLKTRTHV